MKKKLFWSHTHTHSHDGCVWTCRFSIEYSRMRMLKAVRNLVLARGEEEGRSSGNAGGIEDEINKQRSVVNLWKGRCESQLNMLAVCNGNRVFDMVPETEKAYDCPFVISNPYSDGAAGYYVTPTGCLLYYGGEFFNPCRHATRPCSGASPAPSGKVSYTVEEITGAMQRPYTLVKFDVRSTGSDEILGTWPIKFYDKDEGKNVVASQVVERILRWQASSSTSSSEEEMEFETLNLGETSVNRSANIPWRLRREFIEGIFMNGGSGDRAKGSVGNTRTQQSSSFPTKGWGAAEGLVTEGSAAEFCDTIADWWPDVSCPFNSFTYIPMHMKKAISRKHLFSATFSPKIECLSFPAKN
jgi:hypothetical protein